MGPDEMAQTLRVLLASVSTLGMATVDEAGRPHAANVNFAADDSLNLYFVSNPASAHCQHIARNSIIAATAYSTFQRPEEIRGVQLRGRCEPIAHDDFDRVWGTFLRKFPYAQAMEQRVRQEQFYRIAPVWFRCIDNSVRFGFKWETSWPISSTMNV